MEVLPQVSEMFSALSYSPGLCNLPLTGPEPTEPVRDMSIAKEVVCSMGILEKFVQLAIDIQHLEQGIDFNNATDLYEAAENLVLHSDKCAKVEQKLEEAQKKAEEEKENTQNTDIVAEKHDSLDVQEEKSPADFSRSPVDDNAQLQVKVKRLAKENYRLKQRKMCRSCKKVDLASSGVTFLPCGHFITCETCAEEHDNCPACGKGIMGTVRTFLS